MKTMRQDLRHAFRSLRRVPGFTLVAVLTLALGIASTTLVFGVVNSILLRHLPYTEPDQLAMIWGTAPDIDRTPVSVPNFLDYEEHNNAFQTMAAFIGSDGILNDVTEPERIRVGVVSAGFLSVLGVTPIEGRGFREEEDQKDRGSVVILSHGFWERRFAGASSVLGKQIQVNEKSYTVIGVLPADFEFEVPGYFRPVDLWTPLPLARDFPRSNNFLRVIARLKPGVGLERGQEDLTRISQELAREYPDTNRAVGARVVSFREQIVGDVKTPLLALLGSVAFVLLIACANVASLQFERATLRQREITLRRALGASNLRLVRFLLVESLLLGISAGVLGMLMALGGMTVLKGLAPGRLGFEPGQLTQAPVLLFMAVVALLAGVLSGLAPMLRLRSSALAGALREGGRSSTGGVVSGRLRTVLVVLAFSFSLVLLAGAGLLIESFVHLLSVAPGFDPHHVLVAQVDLPRYSYEDAAARLAFFRRATDRMASLPGVEAAGGIDDLPLTSDRDADVFSIVGRPAVPASERPVAQVRAVTPDYFHVMGIPLIKGRSFSEIDGKSAPPVIVINQTMARKFFSPEENPVGERLRIGEGTEGGATIVGVVGDVRDLGLEVEPEPELYRPFAQAVVPYMTLVARTALDPTGMIPLVRKEIGALDSGLPPIEPGTMQQTVDLARADRRFTMFLISVFAAVALILAAVGMYGVMSFWATQKTGEIGLRMALGANRSDVSKLVMGRGALLAGVSILLGVVLSIALAQLISTMLFQASVTDPRVIVGVSLVLGLVALLACWIPARRATRVEPIVALRQE